MHDERLPEEVGLFEGIGSDDGQSTQIPRSRQGRMYARRAAPTAAL
jgi:hypothetical protein